MLLLFVWDLVLGFGSLVLGFGSLVRGFGFLVRKFVPWFVNLFLGPKSIE